MFAAPFMTILAICIVQPPAPPPPPPPPPLTGDNREVKRVSQQLIFS